MKGSQLTLPPLLFSLQQRGSLSRTPFNSPFYQSGRTPYFGTGQKKRGRPESPSSPEVGGSPHTHVFVISKCYLPFICCIHPKCLQYILCLSHPLFILPSPSPSSYLPVPLSIFSPFLLIASVATSPPKGDCQATCQHLCYHPNSKEDSAGT